MVQDRDRTLLVALMLLRFVDCQQAMLVAGFGSVTRANARLLLLVRAGYLRRQFVGSIANGRKAVYSLSKSGALLIGADLGSLKRQKGQLRQGEIYFEHQLQLNRIILLLKYQPLPPDITFRRWLTFSRPVIGSIALVPDGYCELASPSNIRAAFIEADLGTETRRVWQQKIDAYLALAISGEFERIFHQPQFGVLVITSSVRRLDHLRAQIARGTSKLFWLTTFDAINREGFWSAIWLRPATDQRYSLF
jgi:hypothetical protein